MSTLGSKVEEVLKRVRVDVINETNEKQIPWEASSLTGEFYFAPKRGIAVVKRPPVEPQRPERDAGLEKEREQLERERQELERLKIEIDRKKLEAERKRLEAEKEKLAISKRPPKVEPKRTFTNSIRMKFVLIPAGTFTMGSPSDEPGRLDIEKQHRVTLSKGFYIQTTEVTVGQWRAFIEDTGFRTDAETEGWAWIVTDKKWEHKPGYYWDNPGFSQGEDNPVTCVSWNDVQEFIRWLSRKEGKPYRLPTEAEWEYACRAGSTTAFANAGITELECGYNPNLDAMGWYCGNSGKKTHPVAQKNSNAWGLYDMHGNVWEWCQDGFEKNYPSGHVTNPKGPSSGKSRVSRGGGWLSYARFCRSAYRGWDYPDGRSHYLGFRVARDF